MTDLRGGKCEHVRLISPFILIKLSVTPALISFLSFRELTPGLARDKVQSHLFFCAEGKHVYIWQVMVSYQRDRASQGHYDRTHQQRTVDLNQTKTCFVKVLK